MEEEESGSDDKPFEASQKRLDDARKKGNVAQSQELIGAFAFAALIGVAALAGPQFFTLLGTSMANLIDGSPAAAALLAGGSLAEVQGLLAIPAALLLFASAGALAAIGGAAAQGSLVVSLERLRPKGNRLNPIANAKQKFGKDGLVEFLKSSVKGLVFGVVLTGFSVYRLPRFLNGMAWDARAVCLALTAEILTLLVIVAALQVVFGIIDLLVQRHQHAGKLRMSYKEMTDEMKESEGDPHLKGKRRQRAMEIANNRMLADVPEASVVIVNPTHYAVALKWQRGNKGAPICVAKGVDEMAARIRERALEAGVPIHRDPPTARALHATVEIGAEIPPDQYRAVAVAIRFAERMRKRARSLGRVGR